MDEPDLSSGWNLSLMGVVNVNSTGAKNRSAGGTIFRRLGRAKRGPNGEIKPTSN
jgi:hypothetical protein